MGGRNTCTCVQVKRVQLILIPSFPLPASLFLLPVNNFLFLLHPSFSLQLSSLLPSLLLPSLSPSLCPSLPPSLLPSFPPSLLLSLPLSPSLPPLTLSPSLCPSLPPPLPLLPASLPSLPPDHCEPVSQTMALSLLCHL